MATRTIEVRSAVFGSLWTPGKNNFFNDLSPKQQLAALARRDACTTPSEVVGTYGQEWTIDRYTQCNLVGGLIMDQAKIQNPVLHAELTQHRLRKKDEAPAGFESQAVPADYKKVIYAGAKPVLYAASRVLIEGFGRVPPGEVWPIIGSPRVQESMDVLYETLQTAKKPAEFLAKLSRGMVGIRGVSVDAVLGHVLAVELTQENAKTEIKQVVRALQKHAPDLWWYYVGLSPKEIKSGGMLDQNYITKLFVNR